jgi:hypothetical protein
MVAALGLMQASPAPVSVTEPDAQRVDAARLVSRQRGFGAFGLL